MSSEPEKTSLVLFYSAALLIFAETLILRAVPQLFPILATIPLIFVGQILNQRFFILSLIITNSTFFFLSFSEFNLNQIYFSKRYLMQYVFQLKTNDMEKDCLMYKIININDS